MPYQVKKDGDDYLVVKEEDGHERELARHTPPDAKEKAEKQIRLLEAMEHDPDWEDYDA